MGVITSIRLKMKRFSLPKLQMCGMQETLMMRLDLLEKKKSVEKTLKFVQGLEKLFKGLPQEQLGARMQNWLML